MADCFGQIKSEYSVPQKAMMRIVLRYFPLLLMVALMAVRAAAGDTARPYRIVKDVVYQNAEPSERADVYLPANASSATPVPAVIWMHGSDHDKADGRERNVCTQLAAAGYVAISINYGSWPDTDAGEEHSPRILQNIANARNAVRFFRAHAADYGIAPDKMGLFGGSAGAWLALMVGMTRGDAAFDASAPYPGVSSAVGAIGDFYADLDPWLRASISAKSPPVLIIHGKADPAVSFHDSVELAQLLAKLNVPYELVLLDNVGHGFDLNTWQKKPLPQKLLPVVKAFLVKQFGPLPVAGDSPKSDVEKF